MVNMCCVGRIKFLHLCKLFIGTIIESIDLCAKQLTERKTISYLRQALRDVCLDWKISKEKISAVVTDGGANIKGAVREEFGVLRHISCMGHLINGIGQACVGLHNFKVPSAQFNF